MPLFAEARIFNYKESGLAAYMRGTGGMSTVGQEPFGNSSGAGTSVNGSTKLNYGGELGAMIGFGPNVHMRLGIEVIQHKPVADGSGTNAGGAELFKLDSSVFIFNPNVTLEYVYKSLSSFRFYSALGVGLADVTVENRYTMTAQGTTDLGVPSFNEKLGGSGTSAHLLMGFETQFVDNVTFSLDLGYRYMPITSLKYKGDVNNIVAPSGASKGAEALNADGNKRTLDLGGLFMGATFRFYLNFL